VRCGQVHDPKEHNTMSHKNFNPATVGQPKRVAIVISNPGVSTSTGWPVGFWWAELSLRFKDAEIV
jgi:hypothetical protein